jgi:hypothetical protein
LEGGDAPRREAPVRKFVGAGRAGKGEEVEWRRVCKVEVVCGPVETVRTAG